METTKGLKCLFLLIISIYLIGIIQADENLVINCAGDASLGISCLSSEELGTYYGKIPSVTIPLGGGAGGPSIHKNETIIKPTEEKKIDYLLWILILLVIILLFWWFFIIWKRRKKEEKEKKHDS